VALADSLIKPGTERLRHGVGQPSQQTGQRGEFIEVKDVGGVGEEADAKPLNEVHHLGAQGCEVDGNPAAVLGIRTPLDQSLLLGLVDQAADRGALQMHGGGELGNGDLAGALQFAQRLTRKDLGQIDGAPQRRHGHRGGRGAQDHPPHLGHRVIKSRHLNGSTRLVCVCHTTTVA